MLHSQALTRVAPEKAAHASALLTLLFLRVLGEELTVNHYVYLLKRVKHCGLQRLYIGVRSCSCEVKLDTSYFSSSKLVRELINSGESFRKRVLRVFATREEAVAFEVELHSKFKVASNPDFLNRANQTSIGWDTSGTTRSKDAVEKTKATLRKLYSDPDFIEKQLVGIRKHTSTKAWSLKQSEAQKARLKDPAARLKQSVVASAACNRPEVRAVKSAAMQRVWDERPEHRQRHIALMKEAANRPGEREARAARMRGPSNPMQRTEVRERQKDGAKRYAAIKKQACRDLGVSYKYLSKQQVLEWAQQNN